MAEEKSVAKGGNRPWQATTLGVLDSIGVVMCVLLALLAFFMKDLFSSLLGGGMDVTMSMEGVDETAVEAVGLVGDMIASMGSVLGVIFLALAALSYFMARAVFKGKKWSPIVSLVFAILGVLGMAVNFDQSQMTTYVYYS